MVEIFSRIKDYVIQIFSIAEKNIQLGLRVKSRFIFMFIQPFITIVMPLIMMGQLFTLTDELGPWNNTNYTVFVLSAYNLALMVGVRSAFAGQLTKEKYWKTLSALMIAPFKRVNLLLGIYLSHIVMILIPLAVFFTAGYIFYPISPLTIIAVLFDYFLISLIFLGLGLIVGIAAISKETLMTPINLLVGIVFMVSCIGYPFAYYPGYMQNIARLNPLYYIINFARLLWIEDNFIFTILNHPLDFGVTIFFAIISPITGLVIFNYIFNKYGIQGY